MKIHRAYRNPNAQLLGKIQDEEKLFTQAAQIVEGAEFGTVPTQTSEEFERMRLSTTKALVETGTPLTGEDDPSLAVATLPAPALTANGKRIGRPPKMTRAQIEAAGQGPAFAKNDTED